MKKTFVTILIILLVLGAGALLALYISTHNIAMLEPKGLISDKERDLIVTCSLLMLIVVIPVLILTFVFAWKYREKNEKSKHTPNWEHNYIAEMCWWGVPFIIIVILSVITWKTSHDLDPFRPIVTEKKPIEVQVVALNWKWLFIYPEQEIATVNFLQIPEQTPINFQITADAPMNSFWIPQLGGQIYAMAGMTSTLYLLANEQGVYEGRSAHISGKGFSGMVFKVKSATQEEFDEWIKSVKESGKELSLEEYKTLSKPSEYNSPSYYKISYKNLFNKIIMKYKDPNQDKEWE